jgi:hypothetical protein
MKLQLLGRRFNHVTEIKKENRWPSFTLFQKVSSSAASTVVETLQTLHRLGRDCFEEHSED